MAKRNKRTFRYGAINLLVFTIISIFLVALTYSLQLYSQQAIPFAIISGILASLLAGFLFNLVDRVLFPPKFNAEIIFDKLDEISNSIQEIREAGIRQVATRSRFDDAFWLKEIDNVRRNAAKETELIMVGRTLEKWIGEAFADSFARALTTVLKKGGRVKLVTLNPAGHAAQTYRKLSGRDVTAGVNAFDKFVDEKIIPKISNKYKSNIERRRVDEVQLTFTMFKSDTTLWTSPYLSLADTNSNIAILLDLSTPLSSAILTDFRSLWSAHGNVHENQPGNKEVTR